MFAENDGSSMIQNIGASGGKDSSGLSENVQQSLTKIAQDASKVACECNHGLMVETLKKFMF